MNDREKLVELIGKISCRYANCDQECGECTNAELFDEDIEMIADHLLSHGVTIREPGEWIDKPTGAYRRMQSWCSACGQHSGIGGIESNRHKPFCPNCGAPMKGERNETLV